MGLDQYAGIRNKEGEVEEKFYWRKHARLQKFMAEEFDNQNKNKDIKMHHPLLGFNGGQGGVTITTEILQKLEEAIKDGYYSYFADDGFFWGQQFQEHSVKEYKKQDEEFLSWAKKALKDGKEVGYDCSW